MLIVGKRVIPAMLHYIAHTGSRELFRLAVLSVALGVAFVAAELFGVSIALGAFFAGMILSESELSQRAAEESLPLRDAFAVLFFISVGMVFNPSVIVEEPAVLLLTNHALRRGADRHMPASRVHRWSGCSAIRWRRRSSSARAWRRSASSPSSSPISASSRA